MSKNNSELHQRAIPKRAQALNVVDERDDGIEGEVQRVPAFDPAGPDSATPPKLSNVKLVAEDVRAEDSRLSGTITTREEIPHVQVETEEAKQARLDKQWKQLEVDVADLPGIYSRLSKIKLTGMYSLSTRSIKKMRCRFHRVCFLFVVKCIWTDLRLFFKAGIDLVLSYDAVNVKQCVDPVFAAGQLLCSHV